jgi:hypothetical protein
MNSLFPVLNQYLWQQETLQDMAIKPEPPYSVTSFSLAHKPISSYPIKKGLILVPFLARKFREDKEASLYPNAVVNFNLLRSSALSCLAGSRPIAMGGAFSGLADDANSVFWNPAGLAQLTSHHFTGTYNTDWKKLDHDFSFALAIPTKHTGTFAMGYTINWDRSQTSEACVEVCDRRDDSTLFTYGRYIFAERLSAGLSVKRDYKEYRSREQQFERLDKARLDLDLGFLVKLGKQVGDSNRFSIGFLWQDIFKSEWNNLRNFRPGMGAMMSLKMYQSGSRDGFSEGGLPSG